MKIQFNLLPSKQKQHLKMQKMFRIITEQEIQILIICLILFASFFGMYLVIKSEVSLLSDIKEEITNQEQYKDIIEIHKTFKKVKGETNVFTKLTNEHIHWSHLLIMMSELIPDTIIVDSFKTTDNTVTMKATANMREDVIKLKGLFQTATYEDKKCFDNINVPEAELTIPIDVGFTMTFDVNKDCLK